MKGFRIKNFRVRLILTIRYWFHLPQDDLKDQRLREEIEGLVKLNAESVKAVRSLTMIAQQLQLRLAFYETHMPRLRELRRRYEAQSASARRAAKQSMDNGVFVASVASEKPKVVEVPPEFLR